MRKDMKDMLVTPGRSGKSGQRYKRQKSQDVEELDSLPEREKIRAQYGWRDWSFGDHINPLNRWLEKQVGRPFDKVYSEFCKHIDSRCLRGWHARDHFWMEVSTYEERLVRLEKRWYWPKRFYVDRNGILCKENKQRRWRRQDKELDPNTFQVGDRIFERINGCWFEVWYEKVERCQKVVNFWTKRIEERYYYEDVKTCQKQLSKKDMKKLRINNNPNFKWWEHGSSKRSFEKSTN